MFVYYILRFGVVQQLSSCFHLPADTQCAAAATVRVYWLRHDSRWRRRPRGGSFVIIISKPPPRHTHLSLGSPPLKALLSSSLRRRRRAKLLLLFNEKNRKKKTIARRRRRVVIVRIRLSLSLFPEHKKSISAIFVVAYIISTIGIYIYIIIFLPTYIHTYSRMCMRAHACGLEYNTYV